jgi:hypothetical protein
MRRPRTVVAQRFQLPERLTPFTVIGLLREISAGNGMAPAQHAELARQIEELERHFFVQAGERPLDLREIAEQWVSRAS